MRDRALQVEALFEKAYKDGLFNGCVLVAEKGEVVFEGAFGMADFATNQKLAIDSVFDLASVSKPFTAAAILQLRDRGLLSLDDPLETYFPEIPFKGRTIQMLLNHTSGLPDYLAWGVAQPRTISTNEDVVRFVMEKKATERFGPREKWEYSNTAYVLLAVIIAKITGKSFARYMREEIFLPAGMLNTRVYNRQTSTMKIDKYAYGYVNDGDGPILPECSKESAIWMTFDRIQGDGAVHSTVHDLRLWDEVLRRGSIIGLQTQEEAYTTTRFGNGQREDYGFGWCLRSSAFGRIVEHSGGYDGVSTRFVRGLENETCIVILGNYPREYRTMGALVVACEDILAGKEYTPVGWTAELVDPHFEPASYPSFTGEFEGGIAVKTENSKLYLFIHNETFEVWPIGGNRFVSPSLSHEMTIDQDGIAYYVRNTRKFAKRL